MCKSLLSAGFLLGCRKNTAGVELAAISDWNERVYAFTGEIIEGTDAGDGAAQEFYTIEQLLQSASATEAFEGNNVNGAAGFIQTVTLQFPNTSDPRLDDQIRSFKQKLAQGRFLMLVKDQNGHYKLYGAEKGLMLESGEGGMGQARTDLNGNTLVFTSKESESARLVNIPGGGGGATAFTIYSSQL